MENCMTHDLITIYIINVTVDILPNICPKWVLKYMLIVCPCLLEYLGVFNWDIITTLQKVFFFLKHEIWFHFYLLALLAIIILFPQNIVPGVDWLVKEMMLFLTCPFLLILINSSTFFKYLAQISYSRKTCLILFPNFLARL